MLSGKIENAIQQSPISFCVTVGIYQTIVRSDGLSRIAKSILRFIAHRYEKLAIGNKLQLNPQS